MKRLVGLILSLALVGCSVVDLVPQNLQNLDDVSYAVVTAENEAFCSATKIGYETLLTAQHCTNFPEKLHIRDRYGNVIKAEVIKSSTEHDLALLAAPVDGPNAYLGQKPQRWTEVFVVGFPSGLAKFLTKGEWQGEVMIKEGETNKFYGMISAPIAPGNSGGGVFQFQNGRWYLVGVAQAVSVTALGGFVPNLIYHVGFVSDPYVLKEFLK